MLHIVACFMSSHILDVYQSGTANMTIGPVGCTLAVHAECTRRARYGVYESSQVQFTLHLTTAARAQLFLSCLHFVYSILVFRQPRPGVSSRSMSAAYYSVGSSVRYAVAASYGLSHAKRRPSHGQSLVLCAEATDWAWQAEEFVSLRSAY